MTIPRNPRSLHRLSDSRIADTVRTYALQWDQGFLADDAALAAVALKIIHKARRIDAETRRKIEGRGDAPARLEDTAGATRERRECGTLRGRSSRQEAP